MTVERAKLNASVGSYLNNFPEIAERYRAGDPTVTAMLTSIIEAVVWLSRDNDVNITEPFIKSKDRTILADAINKGILPIATPCQHLITIENNSNDSVSLSQGRIIEDGTGRQWRLMTPVNLSAGETKKIIAEQSILHVSKITIPLSESFYTFSLSVSDEAYISGLSVINKTTGDVYQYTPKFMNAGLNKAVYTLQSEDMKTLAVIFGDSNRAGRTVQAGDEYEITLTQCYGEVEAASLSTASLESIFNSKEKNLNIYFHAGEMVRAGANPLSVAQLRLLASFPSMYDQNAVFMGNFDFLVRWHFMDRFNYMAIWNETTHEKHYGASLDSINHLYLTLVAKNSSEQEQLTKDVQSLVAKADSLFEDRVCLLKVQEYPYRITIKGQLAAIHGIDSVRTQIKELLLENYGKGSLSASHPNTGGFNLQEIATRIRNNIPAFQDRISDFTVSGEDVATTPIKPHQWAYLSETSITISLTRTADTGSAMWTL